MGVWCLLWIPSPAIQVVLRRLIDALASVIAVIPGSLSFCCNSIGCCNVGQLPFPRCSLRYPKRLTVAAIPDLMPGTLCSIPPPDRGEACHAALELCISVICMANTILLGYLYAGRISVQPNHIGVGCLCALFLRCDVRIFPDRRPFLNPITFR